MGTDVVRRLPVADRLMLNLTGIAFVVGHLMWGAAPGLRVVAGLTGH